MTGSSGWRPMGFDTFHDRTVADFTPCPVPSGEPDFISRSGSIYWDAGGGVIRQSDHWGAVAGCVWLHGGCRRDDAMVAGACRYDAFRRIVPLSIERHRAVLIAPGSPTPLAGRRVSLVLAAPARGLRGSRWSGGRLRRGRRPAPRRRPVRPPAGAADSPAPPATPPPPLTRTVVTVAEETPFVLVTTDGRRLPRRSHGPAWFVDAAPHRPGDP